MSSWLKCQWCPRWEYSNSASCDHSTMDRNTRETNGGHSWCNNNKKNKNNVLPSLDFFFRTRVPPNFPRKDSSFLIFADCVVADGVPDIFECLWCVCGLSLSLSASVSLLPVMHSGTGVQSNHSEMTPNRQTSDWRKGLCLGIIIQSNDSHVSKKLRLLQRLLTVHPTAPPNGRMRNRVYKARAMKPPLKITLLAYYPRQHYDNDLFLNMQINK